MKDNWIWLPKSIYPQKQSTIYDAMSGGTWESYAVVDFKRKYIFDKNVKRVALLFSGDTAFRLYCNGEFIATGPASVGGDFLRNGEPRSRHYAYETEYTAEKNELDFFVTVRMLPVQICEYSRGHGGFMLKAEVFFEDGSVQALQTDESWLARLNNAYISPMQYDGTRTPDQWVNAEAIDDIWHAETAPIPPRDEKEIEFPNIELMPNEEKSTVLDLDMIYAGFLHVTGDAQGELEVDITCREIAEGGSREVVKLTGKCDYRGFTLHSAGNLSVILKNKSGKPATVRIGFITTCYPVDVEATTVTSDPEINEILNVSKHTLKYCRQTHHLDSPRHCEPLACTGDYYIESLMTAFSFGDQRLSEFDVMRTAELLRTNDGRMFHTTYSLIWVRMLYDTFMMGGNFKMLSDCKDALDLLLNRFQGYVGENGLIETPPDYMFIDWIYIDGLSMHHPPKCLGQTVLNMYYYMALTYAEKIYSAIGCPMEASICKQKAGLLKHAVNSLLFDKERGMYFEGLNTPTDESQIYTWLPANTQKRYYLKHSNVMAAYTSICDGETARNLIDKIMSDEIEGDIQPYFLHYLFEAIYTHGLRDKYTLKLIERWKNPLKECKKGLVEGFVMPEPSYQFDHSHAWGGTPLWSLPKALMGLSIDKPAFAEITLNPSLLGLHSARVELLTPHGNVICELDEGKPIFVSAPEGIKVNLID